MICKAPLAQAAACCIPMNAEPEATVSTRTYVNTLALGQLGAIALLGGDVEWAGAATRIAIDDCSSLEGTGIVTETLPPSDQYQLQGEAFSRAVRGETALPYGIEDAIANMRAIDALFRSEHSGRWEDVAHD